MAKRKMDKAEFERIIKPLIEQRRQQFRAAIRQRMMETDPIRQRALQQLDERDQWQRTKFELSQPTPPPQSTTEDRARMEGELGIRRPLNKALLKAADKARK